MFKEGKVFELWKYRFLEIVFVSVLFRVNVLYYILNVKGMPIQKWKFCRHLLPLMFQGSHWHPPYFYFILWNSLVSSILQNIYMTESKLSFLVDCHFKYSIQTILKNLLGIWDNNWELEFSRFYLYVYFCNVLMWSFFSIWKYS